MTAWATVDLAVQSMRLGVRDFVQKPWENSGLLSKLKTQIEQGQLRRRERDREADTQMRERQIKLELAEGARDSTGLDASPDAASAGFQSGLRVASGTRS
jgi:FixJ family two-component response regulator